MPSAALQPFLDAWAERYDRGRKLTSDGRPILGYFCTYTPVELIHAAGFLPFRIWGDDAPVALADACLPSFVCPFLRRALNKGLNGGYDFLSGIIQGYTCEASCGVVNIWRDNVGGQCFHLLPLPYNNNSKARSYLRAALEELASKLKELGGFPAEAGLRESLDLYARIRRRLLALYKSKTRGTLPLSAGEWLLVNLAFSISPPVEYLVWLEELTVSLNKEKPGAARGLPVLVSGSVIEQPGLLDLIEECGGRVAADDLCTGQRNLMPPDGRGHDSWARLIDRYMNRFPCPARSTTAERAGQLKDLAARSGVRAVIFVLQKFCAPHLGDHPVIQAELRAAGWPGLLLEVEETGSAEGQWRTRLESFFELRRENGEDREVEKEA
ncbi:MAG: 2-hydroxyacyl-CoA dehydratase family protein [Thermodesulfobacteriota bacterium]